MVALIAVVPRRSTGSSSRAALRQESAGGTALGLAIPAALLAVAGLLERPAVRARGRRGLVGNSGRHARTGSGKASPGWCSAR